MQKFFVFVRHANQSVTHVPVTAFGENDAVRKVSEQGLGGVIFAVRNAHSTLPV